MKFKKYIEEAQKQSFTTKDKCSKCGKDISYKQSYGNVQPKAVMCHQCAAKENEKKQPDWHVEWEDKDGRKFKDTRSGEKEEKEVKASLEKNGMKVTVIRREKSAERHD
jgi:hypothetical protein